ncbi:Uncharacterized protein TPAR_03027 [Tolypocladium paradoxum]|uniref:Uncharacterized protein n=1 Tax=Tolypocladium paradoxum TaxID=94208 RepID=A0A2S4L2V6_9HYPO|nr:Uncharacterized protein TPAR_03027 [Tolypocladium paradoxum]
MSSRKPFLLSSLTFSSRRFIPMRQSFFAFLSASVAVTCAALTALNNLTTPLCATFRSAFSVARISAVDTSGSPVVSSLAATNMSLTRPFSSALLFCSLSCRLAFDSRALSTAAFEASCAAALRARTGSDRFDVDNLVDKILDREVANALGSFLFDFCLPPAESESRSYSSRLEPSSSSSSSSVSGAAGAAALFDFVFTFVAFFNLGSSSSELDESTSSASATSSTLAL